ncbi:hypothetical protein EIP91_005279 [Steccherinum ochraceum]|uniref:Coenzyme Q-binding protein COQ10 START domain-containing protein n=1 Tax=Steccherinum ochraceum TaxID=92696 RepID=A0A4V2MXG6_9APHY|nr:hypothetical protein EIP91_005279 [Steccherinum ochraceum]
MLVRPCPAALRHRLTRSLFTLPDFSSLSPFSEPGTGPDELQTYHERKVLPYRPSELYHIVADVASYPEFIPFCTGSRILRKSSPTDPRPSGSSSLPAQSMTMDAELTVGFLSFKERYTSKVTCRPNKSVEAVASSSTPLFKTLTTTWRFQPAPTRSPQFLSSSSAFIPSSNHPQSNFKSPSAFPPPQSRDRHSVASSQGASSSGSVASPKDDDSTPTLVTLEVAFAFASPVHAAVSAAFFGQVSKRMVEAFEERCQHIYGRSRR